MNFKSLFCGHKWKSHQKDKKAEEMFMADIFGDYKKTGIIKEFTKEIFICDKCGKIKIVKY